MFCTCSVAPISARIHSRLALAIIMCRETYYCVFLQGMLFHKCIKDMHHIHKQLRDMYRTQESLVHGCKVLYLIVASVGVFNYSCADCGDLVTMTGRESGICG